MSINYLKTEIRKQMNEMSDHIAGGGCNDFNEMHQQDPTALKNFFYEEYQGTA